MKLNQNLSITGFRIFLLLNLLLKKAASKEEILSALKNNSLEFLNITKETIKLDINTLKAAGFKIENLGKSNKYRYKINWSPIKIKIQKNEVDILENIKNSLIELANWEDILILYGLFEKICSFIDDQDARDKLMNFHYFLNIDFNILKELNILTKRKKTVTVLYKSASELKEITIKLNQIKYTNSKLYITGICPYYPDFTVLRVDNILKIIKMQKSLDELEETKFKAFAYKIAKNDVNEFNLIKDEKIINEDKNFIGIELTPDNDFSALQRLLSQGERLVSIENSRIKEKYLKELNEILKIYKEG